jgi:hypothetical protein
MHDSEPLPIGVSVGAGCTDNTAGGRQQRPSLPADQVLNCHSKQLIRQLQVPKQRTRSQPQSVASCIGQPSFPRGRHASAQHPRLLQTSPDYSDVWLRTLTDARRRCFWQGEGDCFLLLQGPLQRLTGLLSKMRQNDLFLQLPLVLCSENVDAVQC